MPVTSPAKSAEWPSTTDSPRMTSSRGYAPAQADEERRAAGAVHPGDSKPHPRMDLLVGGRDLVEGVGHIHPAGRVVVLDGHVGEVGRRVRQGVGAGEELRSFDASVAEPVKTAACDPGTQHRNDASASPPATALVVPRRLASIRAAPNLVQSRGGRRNARCIKEADHQAEVNGTSPPHSSPVVALSPTGIAQGWNACTGGDVHNARRCTRRCPR